MFKDEFKKRYTTIPFAIYRQQNNSARELISHRHREVELIAMIDGCADFYIDTVHQRVVGGDVLIIPPFSLHRADFRTEGPLCYNCICFDLTLLWDDSIRTGLLDHTLAISGAVRASEPFAEKIREWIEFGCTACEGKYEGWEMDAIGSVSAIFGALKHNGYFVSNIEAKDRNEFVRRVMKYISDSYAGAITSTTAAEVLHMNNSHFCHLFKQSFGCCFSAYLLAYRLEKAKIALNSTSDKITEISFNNGFNSCSYFSKEFKERFGMTPLSYRNSRR